MRKLNVLLFVIIACLVSLSRLASATKIFPAGDSLTAGYCCVDETHWTAVPGGWRAVARPILAQAGLAPDFVGPRVDNCAPELEGDCEHAGYPGLRTDSITLNIYQPLRDSQPDVVVIMAGANDSAQQYQHDAFRSRFMRLLYQTYDLLPNAKIVVVEIPPKYNSGAGTGALSQFVVDNNARIHAIVDQERGLGRPVTLVELYDQFRAGEEGNTHPLIHSDGVHFTAAGTQLAGQLIAAGIQAALEPQVPPDGGCPEVPPNPTLTCEWSWDGSRWVEMCSGNVRGPGGCSTSGGAGGAPQLLFSTILLVGLLWRFRRR